MDAVENAEVESRDVTRPLASAERAAFLAILTALGTEWKNHGVGEIFPAQSPRN